MLSKSARTLAEKMSAGCRLLGSFDDFGRPFTLLFPNEQSAQVEEPIAKELLDAKLITEVGKLDGGTNEFRLIDPN